jgi:hypothetical protein
MVLELSGTRSEAGPAFSAETAAVVRAIGSFIAHVAQPDRSIQPVMEEFQAIGATAAREGRTLDCLAAACARGYAEARLQATGDQHRQLLALILADPPPPPGQLAARARTTNWILPAQVAVVLLQPGSGPETLLLPPGVLADWTAADPCLLVPDPDGPGRQAALDQALRGRPAVIGPSVPLARAAQSLRWARHARALAQSGALPDGLNGPAGLTGPHWLTGATPVRCDQHLSTLLILADEDLAAALRDRCLAPLARLRPAQRDRIAETLLAWLQLGENAAEVAQRIHVHPQTVRYRLRQITELFGDQLRDPGCRFELQLALRIRHLTANDSRSRPTATSAHPLPQPHEPHSPHRLRHQNAGCPEQQNAGHPRSGTADAVRG